jgi:hypothetical protein
MPRVAGLAYFLAVLVLVAHTHCVLAHGHELVRRVQAQRHSRLPVESRPCCENESSCICKGVTLAVAAMPPVDDTEGFDLVLANDVRVWSLASSAPEPRLVEPHLAFRPLCAHTARALLQSFLI